MLQLCRSKTCSNKYWCNLTDNDDYDDNQVDDSQPRRLSETKPSQIVPIPPASSFFVFSQTNR